MWPFNKKLKIHKQVDLKYKIVLAFEHGGHKYYQFEDAFNIPTGRGSMAWTFYEELNMRVTKDYLEKHIRAVDIILNSGKIRISDLVLIHQNLKDRLNLAPFPDHVYKLASVMFFDETESPFAYDYEYNIKKIAAWRADPEMLPFLVKVPLKDLIHLSNITDSNLSISFQVAEELDKLHQKEISEISCKSQ